MTDIRHITFRDLKEIQSGQRTIMYMRDVFTEGMTFGATRWADLTVLVCEVVSVKSVNLLDDLSVENFRAAGFVQDAAVEFEKRWDQIHPEAPFRSNPKVQQVKFRFTGEQKTRQYASICEEEDAHILHVLDEAARNMSLEADKGVLK